MQYCQRSSVVEEPLRKPPVGGSTTLAGSIFLDYNSKTPQLPVSVITLTLLPSVFIMTIRGTSFYEDSGHSRNAPGDNKNVSGN